MKDITERFILKKNCTVMTAIYKTKEGEARNWVKRRLTSNVPVFHLSDNQRSVLYVDDNNNVFALSYGSVAKFAKTDSKSGKVKQEKV